MRKKLQSNLRTMIQTLLQDELSNLSNILCKDVFQLNLYSLNIYFIFTFFYDIGIIIYTILLYAYEKFKAYKV